MYKGLINFNCLAIILCFFFFFITKFLSYCFHLYLTHIFQNVVLTINFINMRISKIITYGLINF